MSRQQIYRYGIITALPKEYAAVKVLLENGEEKTRNGKQYYEAVLPGRKNGKHHIVLTLAGVGTNIAASRATEMISYYTSLDSIIMTGIAGGIPNLANAEKHVRLGDIVVSGEHGIVQYDFTKETKEATEHRHPPRPPSPSLLNAIGILEANALTGDTPWMDLIKKGLKKLKEKRPPSKTDPYLKHPKDKKRKKNEPRIVNGKIASANKLLKNKKLRDYLGSQFDCRAVEMEASGIADATWNASIGYLVVRGICDYCDENKNDTWQLYASVVAAAYTVALIASIPTKEDLTELSTSENISQNFKSKENSSDYSPSDASGKTNIAILHTSKTEPKKIISSFKKKLT